MPSTVTAPSGARQGAMSDQKSPQTTAIAKVTPESLTTIKTNDEYRQVVEHYRSMNYHVLSPVVDVSALPSQWALVRSIVVIDPEPANKDVYVDRLFCEGDEVALAKPALRRLLSAAGVSVETIREDSGHVQYYWAFKARLKYVGLDGQPKHNEEGAEYDLRDGSPRINKMTASAKSAKPPRDPKPQIEGARTHGYRGCESRAIHAATRGLFGLKSKYKRKELLKPFVAFNLVFQPDMSDPQQRAMVAQAALTGASQLYPGAPIPSPHIPANHADGDIIDTKKVEPTEQSSTEATQSTTPTESPKPSERRYVITRVQKETAPGKDPVFRIFTEQTGDQALHTEDESVALTAAEARKQGTPVLLTLQEEEDPDTRALAMWVLSLAPASSAPAASTVPPDALYVMDVVSKSGTTNNKPWTRYTVSFGGGETAVTFSDSLAEIANEAKQHKLPVKVTLTPSEKYPDQFDLTDIGIIDMRQGVLPMTSEL